MEHFARFWIAQQVEHLGCIKRASHFKASEVYGLLTQTVPRQIAPELTSIIRRPISGTAARVNPGF